MKKVPIRPGNAQSENCSHESNTSSAPSPKYGKSPPTLRNNFGKSFPIGHFGVIYAYFLKKVRIRPRIEHFQKCSDDSETSSAPCPKCGRSAGTLGNMFRQSWEMVLFRAVWTLFFRSVKKKFFFFSKTFFCSNYRLLFSNFVPITASFFQNRFSTFVIENSEIFSLVNLLLEMTHFRNFSCRTLKNFKSQEG